MSSSSRTELRQKSILPRLTWGICISFVWGDRIHAPSGYHATCIMRLVLRELGDKKRFVVTQWISVWHISTNTEPVPQSASLRTSASNGCSARAGLTSTSLGDIIGVWSLRLNYLGAVFASTGSVNRTRLWPNHTSISHKPRRISVTRLASLKQKCRSGTGKSRLPETRKELSMFW